MEKIDFKVFCLGCLCMYLCGMLVGYMFGNTIAVNDFKQELRWHYSPNKINTTHIYEKVCRKYGADGIEIPNASCEEWYRLEE